MQTREELLEAYREWYKRVEDQREHLEAGPSGEECEVDHWEDHMYDELEDYVSKLESVEYDLHNHYDIDDPYQAAFG